jgi:hypothetical protein
MVTGGASVMGGNESFAAALAAQRRREAAQAERRAPKQAALAAKVAAHAAKEADTMASFRALLEGNPLSIPRRG